MDYHIGLAKDFKDRNNESKIGAIVGTVVNAEELKISILDGTVLLEKDRLYICSNILKDYTRDFEVLDIIGATNTVSDGGQGASPHAHTVTSLKGKIKLTKDYLKVGDKVMLVATENNQKYFIVDKVVE